jgi:hypothetical protein
MRGGVRWRISARERALLAMAQAIIGAMQKMDGALSPRDRRTALRFVRTPSRMGGQSRYAEGKTRAAWQSMPAYLQHQVAELAKAAGCAEELRRIIGSPPQLPPDSSRTKVSTSNDPARSQARQSSRVLPASGRTKTTTCSPTAR